MLAELHLELGSDTPVARIIGEVGASNAGGFTTRLKEAVPNAAIGLVLDLSETTYLDTETAYWVIPADDAFSVEVITPWDDPTTISPFATAADIEVWIAEQRRRLQSESKPS